MHPLVHPVRRQVSTLTVLATGVALSLAVAAPSAAEETPAAPTSSDAVDGARSSTELTYRAAYGAAKVKSSTGKQLSVSLTASRFSKAAFNITLTRAGESHTWDLPAARHRVIISPKGAGTIRLTPKQSGGLARINLRVTPAGPMKITRCRGRVASKQRNVRISGRFFFDSRSAWGKVGSKAKPFTFAATHRVTLSFGVACPPPPSKRPCLNSVSWSGFTSTPRSTTSVYGDRSGARSTLSAHRSTSLPKPKGAMRHDSVSRKGFAPVLTLRADDTAALKIRGTSGTATVEAVAPGFDYTYGCATGVQHSMSWNGPVVNRSPRLLVKTQAFSDFVLPNNSDLYFSRYWRTD